MTNFTDLGLNPLLLKALTAENYETPTPIQAQAIPHLMQGRDLLGVAQTGTGKTAAFALPILHRLMADRRTAPRRGCRVLVLSPTRELASQIAESFRVYGRHLPLTRTTVFGGVGMGPQIRTMAQGVDVLVATPGRLLDLMSQGAIRLSDLEVFVLDEADQMLDMGFIHAIRKIVATIPAKRQSLFFSATMPTDIADLAGRLLTDPVKVAVTPVATTAERIEQRVMFVEKDDKRSLLIEILRDEAIRRVLVFTRTKHGADRVAKQLTQAGINADAIHGNKSQSQRERALLGFRNGKVRVLVATDIAARGIDVDGVTHVVNFELPNVPESYVHRIGRTARAGAEGMAISFCDVEERAFLRDIEKLIRQPVPVVEDHAYRSTVPFRQGGAGPAPRQNQSRGRPHGQGQRPQGQRPHGHGHQGQGQRPSHQGHGADRPARQVAAPANDGGSAPMRRRSPAGR
ncbi:MULTISPECIES: DEAD/DEAH box helicase [unclassified Inquilinus]|uniref:DEAD/DEAH box helicase n=1 Tax=unclassified Inquilinus TaxID=2645927 RepID=UPI003F9044F0